MSGDDDYDRIKRDREHENFIIKRNKKYYQDKENEKKENICSK